MTDRLQRRLKALRDTAPAPLFQANLHGIEREALRVDANEHLALTPHPRALGSALTNSLITTDYSESLIELITPPAQEPDEMLGELTDIHRFVYSHLGTEHLWSQSLPCPLPPDDRIPIAQYGSSPIGRLKTLYRRGLAERYGRSMQCIAGVHFNFSLADPVWIALRALDRSDMTVQDYRSAGYFALIRNFRRLSWLPMYLFGASPAMSSQFPVGASASLQSFDSKTRYLPHATSLRMSDFGYQNDAQSGLVPQYNSLGEYVQAMYAAVTQPHPAYEKIGTHRDGQRIQINTNVLQIENEYYATIRPKRVIESGERPIQALLSRGIQYVEVRCLDIDPFEPVGIGLTSCLFMEAFAIHCALADSPRWDADSHRESRSNFSMVVGRGREPGLQLHRNGEAIALRAWGHELLDAMMPVIDLLDAEHGGQRYRDAVLAQRSKLDDADGTPSARVLQQMRELGSAGEGAFLNFAHQRNVLHAQWFRAHPLPAGTQQRFELLARESLREQQALEDEHPGLDFDAFVDAYSNFSLTTSHG